LATITVTGSSEKDALINIVTEPPRAHTILFRPIGTKEWARFTTTGQLQRIGSVPQGFEFEVSLYRRPWLLRVTAKAQGGDTKPLRESSKDRGLPDGFTFDPDVVSFTVEYKVSP